MPPADLPPELAAHPQYAVERELGRGGMGVVYLARNRRMDRPEVLKVLAPEAVARPGARDRFLREIRAAARLLHPNVVTAYSVLELGKLLALAMEYVEGRDLARVVRDDGPLPVGVAVGYARQALAGLQHAHETGLVHRDIKPANLILRSAHGRDAVKVLDFGLAKASAEAGTKLTESGTVIGTPAYMAPEQTLDSASADIRADIYSAGCTLYQLLAGRPPFVGTLVEVLVAHRSQPAPLLGDLRPDVPPPLAAVVERMLAKDPATRFATPAEAADALARAGRLAAIPVAVRAATRQPTVVQPLPPGISDETSVLRQGETLTARRAPAERPRLWWPVGVGVGLIGTVAVVAGLLIGRGPSAGPADPPAPQPPAAVDGFRSLFNGHDLSRWRHPPGEADNWRAEGGVLVGRGPAASDLHTDRADFANFRLRVTAAVTGDGALLLPAPGGKEYEVRLRPIRGIRGSQLTGALYRTPPGRPVAPFVRPLTDPGTAFRLEVLADGPRVRVWVNEVPTADYTPPDAAPRPAGRLTLRQTDADSAITVHQIAVEELPPTAGPPAADPPDGPKVVYYWQGARDGQPLPQGRLRLVADGRILAPDGRQLDGAWKMGPRERRLVLRWPNKQAPGGAWVDTYTSADGIDFRGTNNATPQGHFRGILSDP